MTLVVAVGECGLDYFRDYSPRDIQCEAFAAQLALRCRPANPSFCTSGMRTQISSISCADASMPFAVVWPTASRAARTKCTSTWTWALHIGITGWICDERRGQDLQQAVRELPLDRVLLETDAPYLVPRDLPKAPRGRRNEPAYLRHILDATARFMGCEPAELAAAATHNAERLFGLPQRNRG